MAGYMDLDLDNVRSLSQSQRTPFPHQMEAFDALNRTFTLPISGYKGSLLVLPTGGGKTFTAANWICRSVLSRNIKVLWLAQSAILLTQAEDSFVNESSNILHTRKSLKIRTVSSSTSHANSGTIELSDDVIIVTTQTAISDVLNETTGFRGETVKFKLRQWIDNCSDSELFVVLDEAHHAPAYGCRTLLTELRESVPNLYVLGLTATPTHNDQRIRGWLEKIFNYKICYQANINDLYKSNILAKPVYIPKQTGRDMEVDDKLFSRIVEQHKDLPDSIIEVLAHDSLRNNYIVNDYLNNKNEYGKTIIFADRWFQCEYIVEKLIDHGVRADCVYVKSSGSREAAQDGQGRRDNKDNELSLKNFKDGHTDVLVNVKMLTEGVDVPDVKTVMLTRNTTSGILFTQMIGRSLRGKKAGAGPDKDHANIVMFVDNWKRLLPFATIANLSGGLADTQTITRGVPPIEWISIMLVKRACRDMEFVGKEGLASKYYIPVGWFETEYTVSSENEYGDEMITVSNAVLVFESNLNAFQNLIEYFIKNPIPQEWAKESISSEEILDKLTPTLEEIFDLDEDNVDGNLESGIVNIIRHIAQNGFAPEYIPFDVREQYDVDRLADEYAELNSHMTMIRLRADFEDNRLLWNRIYKKFEWFWQSYSDAILRINTGDSPPKPKNPPNPPPPPKPKEDYRAGILERDNRTCRCCGRTLGKGVKLEIDHIIPVKMGGSTTLSNLQLLCKACNLAKGTQHISFMNNRTPLPRQPVELVLRDKLESEDIKCAVKRIINFYYRAAVVSDIKNHRNKNGKYHFVWEISLHEGNSTSWIESVKRKLLTCIQDDMGWNGVEDINFIEV